MAHLFCFLFFEKNCLRLYVKYVVQLVYLSNKTSLVVVTVKKRKEKIGFRLDTPWTVRSLDVALKAGTTKEKIGLNKN